MTSEEITVKLGVDGSALGQGLRSAKERVQDWGGEIKSLLAGYFTVEAFHSLYDNLVEYSDKIEDTSRRLGISTDAVQVWDFALKKNNSSIEQATSFFEKLATSRDKALTGNQELASSFERLGVSLDDLRSKRIEDIAEKLSEIFQSGDPQKLIGDLREIGGKGAGDMVSTLRDGLAESRDEAEKLGIIINEKIVYQLKEAGERWKILMAELRGGTAPTISEDVEGLQFLKTLLLGAKKGFTNLAFGGGTKSFGAGMVEAFDEMVAQDKALRNKMSQSAALAGGQLDRDNPEQSRKISEMLESADKKLERAREKAKTDAEQLNKLKEKDVELQNKVVMSIFDEESHAKALNEYADNRLALAEKQKEVDKQSAEEKKRHLDLQKKIGDETERLSVLQRNRGEDLRAPFQPTIDELASSGQWVRGGWSGRMRFQRGPFADIAGQIKGLEADAKNSFIFDNVERGDADIAQRNLLRGKLESRGIVSPERRLESIDDGIKKLSNAVSEDKNALNVNVKLPQ